MVFPNQPYFKITTGSLKRARSSSLDGAMISASRSQPITSELGASATWLRFNQLELGRTVQFDV